MLFILDAEQGYLVLLLLLVMEVISVLEKYHQKSKRILRPHYYIIRFGGSVVVFVLGTSFDCSV